MIDYFSSAVGDGVEISLIVQFEKMKYFFPLQ